MALPCFDLLLPFFIASAAFACVPGPGMFYAAAQTLARGRRAGWLAALGFHLAGLVHSAAAAFGLAVVLQTVPLLYGAVKLAGAGYLIWLGLKFILAPVSPTVPEAAKRSQCRAVRDGFLAEVLNPKTALFYLAFLPQFTDRAAPWPVWAQVLALGALVNCLFSVTDVVCIVFSERAAATLKASAGTRRLLQRIAGGILVALGIRLALARP